MAISVRVVRLSGPMRGESHYPGTYAHELYNRATTILAGQPVVNEDLVNLPNWLVLRLQIEGEEPLDLNNTTVQAYNHTYDIKTACVGREVRLEDRRGRVTRIASRRFVSMSSRHLGALEWTITAENWSGQVSVLSALDGRVRNYGVPRYRQLESRHLNPVTTRPVGQTGIALMVQTRQSRLYVAQAARTLVFQGNEPVGVERQLHQMEDYIHQTLHFSIKQQVPLRVEKLVSFYTSQDYAINEPLVNAEKSVLRYEHFAAEYEHHQRAWDRLWENCDITLPGDERVQQLVRFHIAHVLMVCSPYTADLDAGVPARGLSGEAYRGHIFWDELYIYPFLNFRLPQVTRGLLLYRYRRLDEGAGGGAGRGLSWGDVSLAERQRRPGRDPGGAPETPNRANGIPT
jgi:trehalose/maltose hydrolase-like predicted phosphorylase